jgi:cytochrome c553
MITRIVKIICLLGIFSIAVANPSSTANKSTKQDPVHNQTPQEKAHVCAACHNQTGISTTPLWPNIAGQHKKYLIKQITEIRDNTRQVPEMHAFVKSLSDKDIYEIAEYFSSQKPAVGVSSTKDLNIAKSMFFSGSMDKRKIPACGTCHNFTAKGIQLTNFPSLAGQHPQYLKKQLIDFRSGERNNDESTVMRSIAKYLTDEEIDALADYISGIQNIDSKK